MNNNGKIRVLMIGPGEGVVGGISTLVDTILPDLTKRVELLYFASVKNRSLKDSGKLSLANIFNAISQYVRFAAALLHFRPAIIHIHTSQGIAWLKDTAYVLVGKAVGCKVVLHMHGGNFDEITAHYPLPLQKYTRYILRLADAIVSVSAEWSLRLARLVQPRKIFTLLNCINIQSVRQGHSLYPLNSTVTLLFIGRIGHLKGAFDLIEAIYLAHQEGVDLHAWMVGPEEEEGDLSRAIELLQKKGLLGICEVPGLLPREVVLDVLAGASFFVLPSYYEGLPMVILEAMAVGLPILATAVGGIPEVVRDGFNGYLIPAGNVHLMAERIKDLAQDSTLRNLMGSRSKEIAECDLNVGVYVERLVEIFNSISQP